MRYDEVTFLVEDVMCPRLEDDPEFAQCVVCHQFASRAADISHDEECEIRTLLLRIDVAFGSAATTTSRIET